MGLLTAVGVNLATGIAIELWSGAGKKVDLEIRRAFEAALMDWCKSKELRDAKYRELFNYLKEHLTKKEFIIGEDEPAQEYKEFYDRFKIRLAEHSVAFHYLEAVKTEAQFISVTEKLDIVHITTSDTNNKVTLLLEKLSNTKVNIRDTDFEMDGLVITRDEWIKKKNFLTKSEAQLSDPSQIFTIRNQIEEVEKKIKDLNIKISELSNK